MFQKIGVLKSFANYTRKNLCLILVFNDVADLQKIAKLKKPWWKSLAFRKVTGWRNSQHLQENSVAGVLLFLTLKSRKSRQTAPENTCVRISLLIQHWANELGKIHKNTLLAVFSVTESFRLKKLAKFSGKHLWKSLFFHRFAGWGPATLSKIGI